MLVAMEYLTDLDAAYKLAACAHRNTLRDDSTVLDHILSVLKRSRSLLKMIARGQTYEITREIARETALTSILHEVMEVEVSYNFLKRQFGVAVADNCQAMLRPLVTPDNRSEWRELIAEHVSTIRDKYGFVATLVDIADQLDNTELVIPRGAFPDDPAAEEDTAMTRYFLRGVVEALFENLDKHLSDRGDFAVIYKTLEMRLA